MALPLTLVFFFHCHVNKLNIMHLVKRNKIPFSKSSATVVSIAINLNTNINITALTNVTFHVP